MATSNKLLIHRVPKKMPNSYKQGDLDTLCGIYAVINACRNASFTLDPNLHFRARDLFKAIVETLASRDGWHTSFYAKALTRSQIELCLHIAKDVLADKGGLVLSWDNCVVELKEGDSAPAFALAEGHLQHAGTSALLRFHSQTHVHWTAIREIRSGKLIPSDSAWFRPMALSSFELEILSLRRKRYSFEQDDLILITLQKP